MLKIVPHLFLCQMLLALASACSNNSTEPKNSTLLRIDSYQSKYADTTSTHTFMLFEEIHRDTINLYHWEIDTFSTDIYDEDWNLAIQLDNPGQLEPPPPVQIEPGISELIITY